MKVNELLAELERVSYPGSADEIIAELGDPTLELPNGSDELSAVFGRVDVTTVNSCEDAQLTVLSGLNSDAIGRKHYSDRDPPCLGVEKIEQLSL